MDWGSSGTGKPFKTLTAAELDLDVTNAAIGSHHQIETNPQNIDIESLATDLSIMGASSDMTLFSITGQHGGETRNFSSFADFEAALVVDLDGTFNDGAASDCGWHLRCRQQHLLAQRSVLRSC